MPIEVAKLYRGDTWKRTWVIKDVSGAAVDLTGASARLHVRDRTGALVLSASTADGKLTIQATDGRIDLVVPAAETVLTEPGQYCYDLEITHAGGEVQTLEPNRLIVLADCTHD